MATGPAFGSLHEFFQEPLLPLEDVALVRPFNGVRGHLGPTTSSKKLFVLTFGWAAPLVTSASPSYSCPRYRRKIVNAPMASNPVVTLAPGV